MQRLTFTFDNGPLPGATDTVLDFLAARSIKATFFVIGERLRTPAGRRLAERAYAEGHWIGNHTLTHGEPLGLTGTRSHVEREIGETQRLIGTLAHPQKFFRPNGKGSLGRHLLSREAADYLVEHAFTLATWNNVPGDWVEPKANWVDRAAAALARSPWSLLVLHDEHIAGMMDTLDEFHRGLVETGVEILQELPPSCLPIRNGRICAAIDGLMTVEPPAASSMGERACAPGHRR
jgi:peptidoglycan/xylan/chitin deacetylase (PgdA/CDA1 family)